MIEHEITERVALTGADGELNPAARWPQRGATRESRRWPGTGTHEKALTRH